MSLVTTFSNLNSLTDISFIAGTDYTIKFVVTSQAGSPIDLSTATCKWYLAPYGTDYTVLRKTGSVIAAGTFSILLSANEIPSFFRADLILFSTSFTSVMCIDIGLVTRNFTFVFA